MKFCVLHSRPDPLLDQAWRNLLSRAPLACHYGSPEFFLEPTLGTRKPFAILALDPDASPEAPRCLGALTGARDGANVTCGVPESPQLTVDPAADAAAVADCLISGLLSVSDGAELVAFYAWNKTQVPATHSFRESAELGTILLDLSGGPDPIFAKCSDRAAIRAARRSGITVREASPEDIPDYYQILSAWSTAKGLPCAPLSYYQDLFRLRNNRRLFAAFYEGRMIAGSVFRFLPGGLAEYSANSSRSQLQKLRPNDLLLWTAIEWACSVCRTFSMCGSHYFLRKFGGEVAPISRYRLDRTFLHRHDLRDTAFAHAHRIFQQLPPAWRDRVRRASGVRS